MTRETAGWKNATVVFQYFYDCGGEINMSLIPGEKLGLVEQRSKRRVKVRGEEMDLGEIAKIKRAIVSPYQEFDRPGTYTLILLSRSDPSLFATYFTRFRKHTAGLLGGVRRGGGSRAERRWTMPSRPSRPTHKDILLVDWHSALLYEEAGYADDYVRMIELARIQLLEDLRLHPRPEDGEDLQRPARGLRESGSEVEKPVVPGEDRQ